MSLAWDECGKVTHGNVAMAQVGGNARSSGETVLQSLTFGVRPEPCWYLPLGLWEFEDTHMTQMGARKMLSEERKTKGVKETWREELRSHMQACSDRAPVTAKEGGSDPPCQGIEMRV